MSSKIENIVIGVVGPVGAGKTELTERLGELLGAETHLERPSKNPFIGQYYADIESKNLPSPVAFQSQVSFLLASVDQARMIENDRAQGVVWDVPPVGDKMYPTLAYESGIMSENDYGLYCQLYEVLVASFSQPDVLAVVTADIDTIVERIRQRGRPMELKTPQSYWESQIVYWNDQLEQDNGQTMVKLDSGEIDWSKDGDGMEQVWTAVQAMLGTISSN